VSRTRIRAAFVALSPVIAMLPVTVSPNLLSAASAANGVPRPDHVVVVMEENHSYSDIIGSPSAPYINSLASQGALFTQSFAVTHPSQPNYLALFSGSTQGTTDDSCPQTFSAANLGEEALAAGIGFDGYSESMPADGYTGCSSGDYWRKHNPWSDFTNVPASSNLTFADFPGNYASLPAVSFVIPNQQDDMHDGTIAQGDSWLQANMDGYAQWAKTHNSLLIVTWDEDDGSQGNQIPTIIVGGGVRPGDYSETINHYNVLRTIEDAYGLGYLGASASAAPITDVWNTSQGAVTVTGPGSQTGAVTTPAGVSRATELDPSQDPVVIRGVGVP
jgi:phosphatidylinositol-3-phosphatase